MLYYTIKFIFWMCLCVINPLYFTCLWCLLNQVQGFQVLMTVLLFFYNSQG